MEHITRQKLNTNINIELEAQDLDLDIPPIEDFAKQARELLHKVQGINLYLHRAINSELNALAKAQEFANKPEIYKAIQRFEKLSKPLISGVRTVAQPLKPQIESTLPILEEALVSLEGIKRIPARMVKSATGMAIPERPDWYSVLNKDLMKKLSTAVAEGELPQVYESYKISPEALSIAGELAGKGIQFSTLRQEISSMIKKFRTANAKIDVMNDNISRIASEFEKASKVGFLKQLGYGFRQPFSKLGRLIGIESGMPFGVALGSVLGSMSVAAAFGGIYMAGRTIKQGFTRYAETAPTKTDLILRSVLGGGPSNVSGIFNQYSAKMALWGIREPQALQYMNQILSATPAFSGSPINLYKSISDSLIKNISTFRLLGIKGEETTKMLTILQSIGVDVSRFDQTKFGKDMLSLMYDTKLIGYKQAEYLKSFTDVIESNKLTYLSAKDLEGIQTLSRKLVETGIPILQGQAPQVANMIYKSISGFGGKFAPLIWANAPGMSIWEKYKAIQSPASSPEILSGLAKTLGVGRTEYGNILLSEFLRSAGIPGNLAVKIVELYGKKLTGKLTETEQKELEQRMRQVYEQTPEGRLNKLVAVSESILRTLEGTIAGNVVKMASVLATKFGYSQNKAMKEYVATDLISGVESGLKALREKAEVEGWSKEKLQTEERKLKETYQRSYGMSLEEANRILQEKTKVLTNIVTQPFKEIAKQQEFKELMEGKPIPPWKREELPQYDKRKLNSSPYWYPTEQELIQQKSVPKRLYTEPLLSSGTLQKELLNIVDSLQNKYIYDRAMQEKLMQYRNQITGTNSIERLTQIFDELKRLLEPQKKQQSPFGNNTNNINITVNIDGMQANTVRAISKENLFAQISDAFISALKEAMARAGVYDVTPALGKAYTIAQG